MTIFTQDFGKKSEHTQTAPVCNTHALSHFMYTDYGRVGLALKEVCFKQEVQCWQHKIGPLSGSCYQAEESLTRFQPGQKEAGRTAGRTSGLVLLRNNGNRSCSCRMSHTPLFKMKIKMLYVVKAVYLRRSRGGGPGCRTGCRASPSPLE